MWSLRENCRFEIDQTEPKSWGTVSFHPMDARLDFPVSCIQNKNQDCKEVITSKKTIPS